MPTTKIRNLWTTISTDHLNPGWIIPGTLVQDIARCNRRSLRRLVGSIREPLCLLRLVDVILPHGPKWLPESVVTEERRCFLNQFVTIAAIPVHICHCQESVLLQDVIERVPFRITRSEGGNLVAMIGFITLSVKMLCAYLVNLSFASLRLSPSSLRS